MLHQSPLFCIAAADLAGHGAVGHHGRRHRHGGRDFGAFSRGLRYKGIKETETKAGHWIAISGCGGLGHLGIQSER